MERPSWRVVFACGIGASHAKSGAPCQDYAAHTVISAGQDQILVAVVCDGAGSAAHSEIGSWLASTTFIELVEVYFENGGRLVDLNRSTVADWITQTADKLIQRARQDGNIPKDYSCTLLAALVGQEIAAFVQIGDGAIVVGQGEEDGWSWVFWPQHGEYANQTVFVLSDGALDSLQFDLASRRIDEFSIFSDGIERMVLHGATRSVNSNFFEQMLMPVRASNANGLDVKLSGQLKEYLNSNLVNSKTNDDKTLFMATRQPHHRGKP